MYLSMLIFKENITHSFIIWPDAIKDKQIVEKLISK